MNGYYSRKAVAVVLTIQEIQQFINEDKASIKKRQARVGQAYYDGEHDIKQYRIFYYNADGELVEDTTRSNIKIPHPFFTELVDQATQYILSGEGAFIKSDNPALQKEMDKYFNDNENFIAEVTEVITGVQTKGFEYMYGYKDKKDRLAFECADSLGVIEVEAKYTAEKKNSYIIYHYIERIDAEGHTITKIIVFDAKYMYFYKQADNGEIEEDKCFNGTNIKPQVLYTREGTNEIEYDTFEFIPFFKMENNKKNISNIKAVKPLIDDYDLMASSLSNNLVDFDNPIYVVKGFEGNDLGKLQTNLKTKRTIGIPEASGSLDIKTIDVPYQSRVAKLDLDEKNIYRVGMGLNMSGLKDTTATTNVAIKAMYSLLDLRCSKLLIKLKQFLRKIIKVVIDEINTVNGTGYAVEDVYFDFKQEIMSNAEENARIELTEAQKQQVIINTLLGLGQRLDKETIIKLICEELDIDYEEIKGQLPKPDEAEEVINDTQTMLDNVVVESEGILNE